MSLKHPETEPMTLKSLLLGAVLTGTAAIAAPALAAAPVMDCPNRNAPFTLDSPLIDILLSPAARAIVEQAAPGRLSKMPPRFTGTTTPSFAAILTLRDASRFTGLNADAVAALEPQIKAIPVTAADKILRCQRFDNEIPQFNLPKGQRHILLFEKINGFKDEPSVNAARAALTDMARRKGWALAITEKGGSFNPKTLQKFDVVIWNNISGDVLTLAQRDAFQRYLKSGGGFVAFHGSAGDPAYFWNWYADSLIGARFKGHPMTPQFQEARVAVANPAHPIAKGLPGEWVMNDEWYSFKNNPRAAGANVVLTLDESSYKPVGMMNQDLRMGSDHPLAWTNCIGKGRMFYSAIGHRPETYSQPQHVILLENAIDWASDKRQVCKVASKP